MHGESIEKQNQLVTNPLACFLPICLRLFVGIVLVYAAVPKILHPLEFLEIVYGYDIVGTVGGTPVALVIPFLELLLGISLILNYNPNAVLGATTVLFGIFALVLASALVRDLDISCGCFDSSNHDEPIGYDTLARTCALFVVTGGLWRHEQ